MKPKLALLVVCWLTSAAISQDKVNQDAKVTDAATAIKIAESILVQKFGKSIRSERPFTANLKGETWLVTGNAHCSAPQCFGAAAAVEISESDGHILAVYGPKK
jgi:hypothetical protein